MSNPICPKCKTESIINIVLHKEFFYCRVCKEEVTQQEEIPTSWGTDGGSYLFTLHTTQFDFCQGGRLAPRKTFKFCQGGPKTNLCNCVICQEAYS